MVIPGMFNAPCRRTQISLTVMHVKVHAQSLYIIIIMSLMIFIKDNQVKLIFICSVT